MIVVESADDGERACSEGGFRSEDDSLGSATDEVCEYHSGVMDGWPSGGQLSAAGGQLMAVDG
jgi:hypothetical protein